MRFVRTAEGYMRTDLMRNQMLVQEISTLNILDKRDEHGTKWKSTNVSEEHVASIFRVDE
jgi:hypothetical protein